MQSVAPSDSILGSLWGEWSDLAQRSHEQCESGSKEGPDKERTRDTPQEGRSAGSGKWMAASRSGRCVKRKNISEVMDHRRQRQSGFHEGWSLRFLCESQSLAHQKWIDDYWNPSFQKTRENPFRPELSDDVGLRRSDVRPRRRSALQTVRGQDFQAQFAGWDSHFNPRRYDLESG